MYRVTLRARELKGECPVGYRIGEKIVIEDGLIDLKRSDRVCLYALGAMLPYLTVLYRKTPEEDWINLKEEIQCPDNKNTVLFGIKRVKTKKAA